MRHRPAHVERAVVEGDTSFLSACGRKGGLATARKREREREIAEAAQMRLAEEIHERAIEANEHIVPIDADDERYGV